MYRSGNHILLYLGALLVVSLLIFAVQKRAAQAAKPKKRRDCRWAKALALPEKSMSVF